MSLPFSSTSRCLPLAISGAVLLLALTGCRRAHDPAAENGGHSHSDDDAHTHPHPADGLPPYRLTIYSDQHEVYLEHPAAVAGAGARFLAHVSDLRTGDPRSEGSIRYVFRQGDSLWEQTVEQPAPPGIYASDLSLPKSGDWQGTLIISGKGTNDSLSLGTLQVFPDAHDAEHARPPDSPVGITFTKEQQWKLHTRVEPVTEGRITDRIRAAGTVVAPPGSLAQVMTPVAGTFHAAPDRPLPRLGERVRAGQLLASIHPSFSEATAKLGETEGEIVRARLSVAQSLRELDRVRLLVEAGVESRQNLELAQLAADSTVASLEAALATRSSYQRENRPSSGLPRQEISSPIAGIVVSIPDVVPGQYVGAERTLYTVLEPGRVLIEARVPEAGAAGLGEHPGSLAEFPGRRGEFIPLTSDGGRLVFASPMVDPATHSITYTFEIPDPEGRLRIGEHLTVHLESGAPVASVVIPERAILEEQGQPVAYVQISGETFQRRDLRLGIRDGNRIQVLDGLRPGERIVTDGANFVRLAGLTGAVPSHGHVH